MAFEERLSILQGAGLLSQEDRRKVEEIIAFLGERGLPMEEETATGFVTHLCAALDRVRKGEPIETFDPETYASMQQEPNFQEAWEMGREVYQKVPDLPEAEQKFITLHLQALLVNSQRAAKSSATMPETASDHQEKR